MMSCFPDRFLLSIIVIALCINTMMMTISAQEMSGKERKDKSSAPCKKRNKLHSWDFSVVGHRGGASGLIPEHSVMSYTIGAQHGADYLEPDVVFTTDGVPILRHDVTLDSASNVDEVYSKESDKYSIDLSYYGRTEQEGGPSPHPIQLTNSGYFAWDFSYAEIQNLSLRSDDLRPSPFDQFNLPVMTMEDFLQLIVNDLSPVLLRPIGVIPEIKFHHEFTQRLGEDVEIILFDILAEYGYLSKEIDASNNNKPFYSVKTLCELASDINIYIRCVTDSNSIMYMWSDNILIF